MNYLIRTGHQLNLIFQHLAVQNRGRIKKLTATLLGVILITTLISSLIFKSVELSNNAVVAIFVVTAGYIAFIGLGIFAGSLYVRLGASDACPNNEILPLKALGDRAIRQFTVEYQGTSSTFSVRTDDLYLSPQQKRRDGTAAALKASTVDSTDQTDQ
jgi:hypothetical protein